MSVKKFQSAGNFGNDGVDCEAIRARIALKLGGLLSFMSRKNPHAWEKMPIEGVIYLRSHSIPLTAWH